MVDAGFIVSSWMEHWGRKELKNFYLGKLHRGEKRTGAKRIFVKSRRIRVCIRFGQSEPASQPTAPFSHGRNVEEPGAVGGLSVCDSAVREGGCRRGQGGQNAPWFCDPLTRSIMLPPTGHWPYSRANFAAGTTLSALPGFSTRVKDRPAE